MKYRVIIGWRCEFDFDDAIQAMEFLKTAVEHKSKDNDESFKLVVIMPELAVMPEDEQDV